MSHRFEIGIDNLTKIEGHAKLTVKVEENEVKEAALEVFESSRFFEAMLRNRKYNEAASISSRICGICSVIHHIVSLKAVENALNIQPS
jgi:sulfhydrogenase subunit alpha